MGQLRLYGERGKGGDRQIRAPQASTRDQERRLKTRYAWRRLSTRQETQEHLRGRRLLRPSTHTQAKYHQPHRSGGETIKQWDAGKQPGSAWHRPSVSHTGGRRVTTGAPGGGGGHEQQTDGEEARGGKRDARAGNGL